jgi:hypothetical protein
MSEIEAKPEYEAKSDSNAQVVTFSSEPGPAANRAEVRIVSIPMPWLAVEPLLVEPPRIKRRTVRRSNQQVLLRDAKIRDIAENLAIEKYALKAEHLQPPLTPRQSWRDKGCPASMVKAVGSTYWRKRVADERANAWRRFNKT